MLPKEANDTINAHAAAHGGQRMPRQCVADEHYVPTVLAVHGLDAEVSPPLATVQDHHDAGFCRLRLHFAQNA